MKKIILSVCVMTSVLFGDNYTSTLEPINEVNYISEINGKIKKVDYHLLNNIIEDKEIIVYIEDSLEKKKLKIINKNLNNISKISKLKEMNYKIENSVANREIKYIEKNLLSSSINKNEKLKLKNNILNVSKRRSNELIKTISSKIDISKIRLDILNTEDIINKKNIKLNNIYLLDYYVSSGQSIKVGDKLFSYYDLSVLKIDFYMGDLDKSNISSFMTGKSNSKYKILSTNGKELKYLKKEIYKVTDGKYIGLYKVRFYIDPTSNNIKQIGKIFSIK